MFGAEIILSTRHLWYWGLQPSNAKLICFQHLKRWINILAKLCLYQLTGITLSWMSTIKCVWRLRLQSKIWRSSSLHSRSRTCSEMCTSTSVLGTSYRLPNACYSHGTLYCGHMSIIVVGFVINVYNPHYSLYRALIIIIYGVIVHIKFSKTVPVNLWSKMFSFRLSIYMWFCRFFT